MCRHAAAVGPGIAIAEIMRDLPHSLLHQSYRARELLTGVVCADGFGIGWYEPDVRPEPGRYASPFPIWSDGNLASFGPLVRSPMILGAVRNATVAGRNDAANCAPFASGRHLLSLNGHLEAFDEHWRDGFLRDLVAPARRPLVQGSTDGELLFQAVLSAVDAHEGSAALATAVQETLRNILGHARETGLVAQVNVLASDGESLVATRAGTEELQNSLYLLRDGEESPGSTLVASEPLYDDPLWEPVPPDTVLVLRGGAPPVRLAV